MPQSVKTCRRPFDEVVTGISEGFTSAITQPRNTLTGMFPKMPKACFFKRGL